MKAIVLDSLRPLFLAAAEGDSLPDSLVDALSELDQGHIELSGVVRDVELRTVHTEFGSLGTPRRFSQSMHLVSLRGTFARTRGELSLGLHAVLARELESGFEVVAGELVSATAVAVEGIATPLQGVLLERALHSGSGMWTTRPSLRAGDVAAPSRTVHAAAPAVRPRDSAWAEAMAVSAQEEPAVAPPPPRTFSVPDASPSAPSLPQPIRPAKPSFESVFPEPGDTVEHFAFGQCDVVKSDGDRIHLKLSRDGRIKELALERLKVVLVDGGSGASQSRKFRLDRKL